MAIVIEEGYILSPCPILTCFGHHDILAKTRSRMTTAITLSPPKWLWLTRAHYSELRNSRPRLEIWRSLLVDQVQTTKKALSSWRHFSKMPNNTSPFYRLARNKLIMQKLDQYEIPITLKAQVVKSNEVREGLRFVWRGIFRLLTR